GGALVINQPDLAMSAWPLKSPPLRPILEGCLRSLKQSFLRRQPNVSARALFSLLSPRENWQTADGARIGIPESYYFDPAMSDCGFSSVSAGVIARTDLAEVRSRRRENYSRLLEHVLPLPGCRPLFTHLPAGVCPLSLPVVVRDARQAARRLQARSVP